MNKQETMKKAILGSYIRTNDFGQVGRIYQKHHNFALSGTDKSWLEGLSCKPHTKEELDAPWVSVLCQHGGAIMVSVLRIELIDPVELDNSYEEFYFGK